MAESRPPPLDYAAGKAKREAAPLLPAAETTLLEGVSRAFVLFLIQSLAFLFLVGCLDDSRAVFSPRLVFIMVMVLLPSILALAVGLISCILEYQRGQLGRHWRVAMPGMVVAAFFIAVGVAEIC